MIHHCTVYRVETGEIMSYSNFSLNDDPEAIARNYSVRVRTYGETGYGFVPIEANAETHYVVMMEETPVVAERPPLIVHTVDDRTTLVADGEDSIVLTGLPNPCEIIIDDPDPDVQTEVISVSGGGFVFMADDPGVYTVEVRRWPFLPFKIEFTAT